MRVEILNTGTELMMGFAANSHLTYLARKLNELGLEVARQTTVGDDSSELATVFRDALDRTELLIVTGGLGPTSDDITRTTVAQVLGLKLRLDPAILESIRQRFALSKRPMPKQVEVQAMIPEGATILPNPNGTAPGLALTHRSTLILLLPGPTRELKPMFEKQAFPLIKKLLGETSPLAVRTLKIACLGESVIEERIGNLVADLRGVELSYCARPAEVDVRIVVRSQKSGGAGVSPAIAQSHSAIADDAVWQIRSALGTYIFGEGDDRLEEVVVRLLTERQGTLSVAESCTGGFLSSRITNVSGSSAVFVNGLVTYSNEAKSRLLGVSATTLEKFGAVSEETARAMADGVRIRSQTNYGIGITGIAGPTGGTPDKPVGTVFIALATPDGTKVSHHRFQFDRETFKFVVTQYALEQLRRHLLNL